MMDIEGFTEIAIYGAIKNEQKPYRARVIAGRAQSDVAIPQHSV